MYRYIIVVALLLITSVANYGYSKPEASLTRKPLIQFPKNFQKWTILEGDNTSEWTIPEGSL